MQLHQARPHSGPPLTQATPPAVPNEDTVDTRRITTSMRANAIQPPEEEEPQLSHQREPTSAVPVPCDTSPPSRQQVLRPEHLAFAPGPVQLHLVLALRPHVHLDEEQLLLHLRGTMTGLFGQVPQQAATTSTGSTSGLWSKNTEAFFGLPRPEPPVFILLTDMTESECGSSNLGSFWNT